jgi:phage repressor protein C with HTH and peptisase S24 domain
MARSGIIRRKETRKSTSDRERFADRVSQLATFVGGPKRLSERSGLSRAVIGKYLVGKSEPSRDRLLKLAGAAGISLIWLATGQGEMCAKGDSLARPVSGRLNRAGLQLSSDQIVDHLAFKEEWIRQKLRADPSDLVLIQASGDAMAPTIQNDDLLLVDASPVGFRHDGIYAIVRPDGLAVKRLVRRIDGSFEIRNDNPVYGSEIARSEAFSIIGRVLWFGRQL